LWGWDGDSLYGDGRGQDVAGFRDWVRVGLSWDGCGFRRVDNKKCDVVGWILGRRTEYELFRVDPERTVHVVSYEEGRDEVFSPDEVVG